jgi:hypothetical protein
MVARITRLSIVITAFVTASGPARGEGLVKGPPWPQGMCSTLGGCGSCGDPAYRVYRRSQYKPPYYHASMPFGYYTTLWTRWSPTSCGLPAELERRPADANGLEVEPLPFPTPIRPEPEVEPLPAPRPLDMTRLFGGPRLPDLLPPSRR